MCLPLFIEFFDIAFNAHAQAVNTIMLSDAKLTADALLCLVSYSRNDSTELLSESTVTDPAVGLRDSDSEE